jgi:signal transduction histidine kinase
LALGYVVVLVANDHHGYRRPALGWGLLGVMALWSVIAVIGYERLPRWPWWLIASDVAVACGLVLATLAVQTEGNIDRGAATLPAAWAAAPVFAAAVAGGPVPGGVAAAAVSIADVIERGTVTQHTFNGVVLLLLCGVVGGYVVQLGERAERAIERATRQAAAVDERERLAREIHDSTLQVLALVARRGAEIGGATAELGRLAADQEVALRALVTGGDPAGLDGSNDLRATLAALASTTVTVSGPADPVVVPAPVAHAIRSAVSEAVANVARHAGEGARAWVLVEDDAGTVTVRVRDDGVGFAAGRLAEAEAAGRLGVVQSILGRVEAIGGTAAVASTPGEGTEVEIRVPR